MNVRIQETHLDLINEIGSIYKTAYDLKYSQADIVQMALESMMGKEAILEKQLIENVWFRGNVDLRKIGVKRKVGNENE